jgi:hypothetical protein
MKTFTLQPGMRTLGGVFYPTGYMVLMFPTEQDARRAARLLDDDGIAGDDVCFASPEEFEREITPAMDDDDALPSAGTEGQAARRFRQLARQGHHALMVHAPSPKTSMHLMDVLRDLPISYGQKYRHLVIEDLA